MKNERPIIGLLCLIFLIVGLAGLLLTHPELVQSGTGEKYTRLATALAVFFWCFIASSLIAKLLMIFNGRTHFFSVGGVGCFILLLILTFGGIDSGQMPKVSRELMTVHYVFSAMLVVGGFFADLLDLFWLNPPKNN
ncbi:MAG: hypothetical protein Q8P77_02270 [Candidatus Veblenbacteria bacterium]|nr:hypothetical protein [Candidatus Veblenbacteria bacterium]